MSEQYGFDGPKVSRDEATELCVYHLRMAAALYQVVPEDDNFAINEELDRQFAGDIAHVSLEPARAWAQLMLNGYNRMKDDD